MTSLKMVEMKHGPPQLMDHRYSYAYTSVFGSVAAHQLVFPSRIHLAVLCENVLSGHSIVLCPNGKIAVVAKYNCEGDGDLV